MIVFSGSNRSVDVIDMRDTMYPSYAVMARTTHCIDAPEIGWATMFGFSFGNSSLHIGKREYNVRSNQYFSIPVRNEDVTIDPTDDLFAVFRLGFIGHDMVGTQDISKPGKLSYIDGCSDSLMVYPPRQGDPSLNYLHFPKNINQSYHTHPSLRIGCVVSGKGVSDADTAVSLIAGTFFCLEEHELHRFRTENSDMKVIAYHPDGDWGPTDENHTMLNRTYIKR